MSWITATMAATAILNSKRSEMYAVTRTKKMIRAWMAFLVTFEPHVEPTWFRLTESRGTWAASASAAWTLYRLACSWSAGTLARSAVT